MTVTGLRADLYYSDNPIYISFEEINPNVRYIEIYISQGVILGNSDGASKPIKLYPRNGKLPNYDISHIVKAQFLEVANNTDYTSLTPFVIQNNWRRITFVFTEVLIDYTQTSTQISKTFVKGGKRVQATNQNTVPNRILSPVEILPQWQGLPVSYNYFNSNKQMVKDNRLPVASREIRKRKGCDPLYLKFRNSMGGYSYWYFENWEEKTDGKSLGYVSKVSSFFDLGSDQSIQIEATSKVPKRYYPLIRDLVLSPEIYMYKAVTAPTGSSLKSLASQSNSEWERIKRSNNKVTQNLFNTNEKVKLKFDRILNYNPSEIW